LFAVVVALLTVAPEKSDVVVCVTDAVVVASEIVPVEASIYVALSLAEYFVQLLAFAVDPPSVPPAHEDCDQVYVAASTY
jgi:hypothetical protein